MEIDTSFGNATITDPPPITIGQFHAWIKAFMDSPEKPEDKLIPVAKWRIDLWKWEAQFSSPETRHPPSGNARCRRRTRRVQDAYWKTNGEWYQSMNFI
jgi:hypothetical protein